MDHFIATAPHCEPWNKGKIVGQKAPLKLKDIWAIRVRLRLSDRLRETWPCSTWPLIASCALAIS
jgi:hypothetical protein